MCDGRRLTAPPLPQFGIRLSGALDPRRCVELAGAAESAGFASVWFAENPFQRAVLATAGACAAATRRVRIGIGVVNPYGRHPTLLAMEFAALDELSQGRAALGIGSGIALAARRMGFAEDRPVSAVREAIAIIRAMLAGDSATVAGRVFRVDGARLGFQPRRADLPIYMAAAGERAATACGEVADGLIVSNLTPPRSTGRLSGIAGAAAARTGRPAPRIVQYVPCVARADGEAARQVVKTTIGEMLRSFWPIGEDWPPAKEAIVADSGIPRRDFAAALGRLRRKENAAAVLDERFVAAFAIAGTIEECLQQAARYRAAGADELALTFAGAQPFDDIAYFGRGLR
jgi:5,10-methylenetetrahydromethanopterin reductase